MRSIPDDEGAESTVERQRQVELEVVETRCSGMTREISMRSTVVHKNPTSYISPYGA